MASVGTLVPVSAEQVVALAAACAVLIIMPGPSVLFVVGRALSYGRRVALSSVLGNITGSFLVAVCVALGLGALLEASQLAFSVLKLVGAAYLVWLGVQALRDAGHVPGPAVVAGDPSSWPSVRSGVVVAVTNPEMYLVFAAVIPPFVDRAAGHVTAQMLLLSLVPLTIGLLTGCAWALAAGHTRTWLASSSTRLRTSGRVGGAALIALGLFLAATGWER
ncbi:LysE family translocator [Kineococcus sp. NUM-3379]